MLWIARFPLVVVVIKRVGLLHPESGFTPRQWRQTGFCVYAGLLQGVLGQIVVAGNQRIIGSPIHSLSQLVVLLQTARGQGGSKASRGLWRKWSVQGALGSSNKRFVRGLRHSVHLAPFPCSQSCNAACVGGDDFPVLKGGLGLSRGGNKPRGRVSVVRRRFVLPQAAQRLRAAHVLGLCTLCEDLFCFVSVQT